jgi:hypothetical protein
MSGPTKFETIGGQVTRGECFMKMLDLIRQLRDQMLVMSHLHNTEGNKADELLAQGWRGMEELMQMIEKKLIALASNKLH